MAAFRGVQPGVRMGMWDRLALQTRIYQSQPAHTHVAGPNTHLSPVSWALWKWKGGESSEFM